MPGPDAALTGLAPALARLAEAEPAREVCGLVVRRPDGSLEPWPMANAAPRPAAAFELAPGEVLAALRRLAGEQGQLVAVYHSHPFGGADLSPRDLAAMLAEGQPLLPGVAQVVVALAGGSACTVRLHRWDGDGYAGVDLWRVPAGRAGRGPGA